MVGRRVDWVAVAVLLALLFVVLLAGRARGAEGDVRYAPRHDPSFDPYTSNPTTVQQDWINAHWDRALVFHSWTKNHLPAFPGGWVYRDSYALKPEWTITQQHPEWVLRDSAGNMLWIDFACNGQTCTQHAADIGNVNFKNWWKGELTGWLAARDTYGAPYKGVWVDDVNMDWRISNGAGATVIPVDPRTGTTMTLTAWRDYMADFMEEVRATFQSLELAHNAIWYAANALTDVNIRRQILAADIFVLERGASDAGLTPGTGTFSFQSWLAFTDYVHSLGRKTYLLDYADTTQKRELALAGYLVQNAGVDYLGTDTAPWSFWDGWWPGWDVSLQAATSGWQVLSGGVIQRPFQCGLSLVNPKGNGSRTVSLAAGYSDLSGAPVGTSLVMPDWSGKVLTKACPPPGGGCYGCHERKLT